MRAIAGLICLFGWIMGIIIANGFVSTFVAIFFPFWAWYLSVEHLLLHYGIL